MRTRTALLVVAAVTLLLPAAGRAAEGYANFDTAGLRDLETGEVLTGKKVPEGQSWFRSPDAGKTVVKVPVKFKRE